MEDFVIDMPKTRRAAASDASEEVKKKANAVASDERDMIDDANGPAEEGDSGTTTGNGVTVSSSLNCSKSYAM